MPDKTVSIINGVLRVNGIVRGHIMKDQHGDWSFSPRLRDYLAQFIPLADLYQSWPTRKAAAEWVKDRLTNR